MLCDFRTKVHRRAPPARLPLDHSNRPDRAGFQEGRLNYEQLPSDARREHPFHMYEEIKAQPEAVRRSLAAAESHSEAGAAIARARRVFVTGCGTSFHAAQVGAWLFRALSVGQIDARAVEAYELFTFEPGLRPDDALIAVTHSGGTPMTLRAVKRAADAGAETIAVTGFGESEAGRAAGQTVITGYNDERSWAHTASYTAALATLAAIANNLAAPEARLDLSLLPAAVPQALDSERTVHAVAAGVIAAERDGPPAGIVFVGGGPNAPTAFEATLKVLEASYVRASAFELEEVLHGPLAAVSPEALFVIVAPAGRSLERAREAARAVAEIGIEPLVLTDDESAHLFPDAHRLLLPPVPEALSPIVYGVPLQLLSYFLALGRGANPDLLHRDDERYRLARAQYS